MFYAIVVVTGLIFGVGSRFIANNASQYHANDLLYIMRNFDAAWFWGLVVLSVALAFNWQRKLPLWQSLSLVVFWTVAAVVGREVEWYVQLIYSLGITENLKDLLKHDLLPEIAMALLVGSASSLAVQWAIGRTARWQRSI